MHVCKRMQPYMGQAATLGDVGRERLQRMHLYICVYTSVHLYIYMHLQRMHRLDRLGDAPLEQVVGQVEQRKLL